MKLDKGFIAGSSTMLILSLVEREDMYGYEMIEKLRERSENVFELKAGTLHPLLHGLEEKGCLKSYEKPAGGKLRKYYSITKAGKKVLEEKKAEWDVYSRAVASVMSLAAV